MQFGVRSGCVLQALNVSDFDQSTCMRWWRRCISLSSMRRLGLGGHLSSQHVLILPRFGHHGILVSPQIYQTITESFWLPLHLSHFPLSRHAYGLGLASCLFCLTLGSQDGVLDALDAWKRHLDQIMMSQIG